MVVVVCMDKDVSDCSSLGSESVLVLVWYVVYSDSWKAQRSGFKTLSDIKKKNAFVVRSYRIVCYRSLLPTGTKIATFRFDFTIL
jgi:hypothetical protein